ncbi:MAG TPA: hypothetical protein VN764_07015 [Polyangiaceae bacterium]|nr:hypothetical protein [Polyangiaceae bacterium]
MDDVVSELHDFIWARLRERPSRTITLDELGDAVGARAITAAQIEALIVSLEEAGVTIGGDEQPDLKQLLKTVVQTALDLRRRGERAHAASIAAASGLSPAAVKIALLYSEVIRKP